jgi:hypothetical protein
LKPLASGRGLEIDGYCLFSWIEDKATVAW